MTKLSRLTLMLLVSLALMASFGCGSKNAQTGPSTATTAGMNETTGDMAAILEDAGITLETTAVYFAFDRYDLDTDAREMLRVKSDILKQYPEISVKIEGHCDARGTEEYNLALGERRAKAAYDYLVMLGVNPAQLSMVSYGKLYPAMEGSNEEAWSKNRRDEFRPTINY